MELKSIRVVAAQSHVRSGSITVAARDAVTAAPVCSITSVNSSNGATDA
jgi:hypothetical protein